MFVKRGKSLPGDNTGKLRKNILFPKLRYCCMLLDPRASLRQIYNCGPRGTPSFSESGRRFITTEAPCLPFYLPSTPLHEYELRARIKCENLFAAPPPETEVVPMQHQPSILTAAARRPSCGFSLSLSSWASLEVSRLCCNIYLRLVQGFRRYPADATKARTDWCFTLDNRTKQRDCVSPPAKAVPGSSGMPLSPVKEHLSEENL